MGTVWIADHLTLHTQVAVKFMTAQLASSADATARFTREATAAAAIKSPHVVQILDHGLLEGRIPYIVMELLEGENLSSFIHRHEGKLSPAMTADVIAQMCKALSKAHARNVIHRDIKPDNVFLVDSEGDFFVKLLDFGIAKETEHDMNITSTGTVMGTPFYMSPEQMLSSKHVDARSDLWAVGVVAYQCLTGRLPFHGQTLAAVAVAVTQAKFELPYATMGIGSSDIDAWFSRALAKDPNDRFSSAREMADAFAASALMNPSEPPRSGAWAGTGGKQSSAPAAPRTFAGISATMSNRPLKRRAYTIGAVAAVATLFLSAVVLRIATSRRTDDSAETVGAPPAEASKPVPSVVTPEPPNQIVAREPSVQAPSATPALRASIAPALAESAVASPPPPSKKAALRPRSVSQAAIAAQPVDSPPADSRQKPPGILDRGF